MQVTGEIRVHISPTLDRVTAIGMTDSAAKNLGFLMCASEYGMKVSADNTPHPLQTLTAIAQQVEDIYASYKDSESELELSNPGDSDLWISFRVTGEHDFSGQAEVAITSGDQNLDKKTADRLIDVAVPTMVFMFCMESEAGFQRALQLMLEGARTGYRTTFSKD